MKTLKLQYVNGRYDIIKNSGSTAILDSNQPDQRKDSKSTKQYDVYATGPKGTDQTGTKNRSQDALYDVIFNADAVVLPW